MWGLFFFFSFKLILSASFIGSMTKRSVSVCVVIRGLNLSAVQNIKNGTGQLFLLQQVAEIWVIFLYLNPPEPLMFKRQEEPCGEFLVVISSQCVGSKNMLWWTKCPFRFVLTFFFVFFLKKILSRLLFVSAIICTYKCILYLCYIWGCPCGPSCFD